MKDKINAYYSLQTMVYFYGALKEKINLDFWRDAVLQAMQDYLNVEETKEVFSKLSDEDLYKFAKTMVN